MALDFSGGIIAYSSPVPDLLGVSNITSEQIFWEKQSHGLLTDGAFGLRDIRINKILSYGKKRNISSRKSMIFGSKKISRCSKPTDSKSIFVLLFKTGALQFRQTLLLDVLYTIVSQLLT